MQHSPHLSRSTYIELAKRAYREVERTAERLHADDAAAKARAVDAMAERVERDLNHTLARAGHRPAEPAEWRAHA